MDRDSSIPLFRVLSANESADTAEHCMRIGWRATDDGILVPRRRLACSVLHLAGNMSADASAFAATVAAVCGEAGARAVFWELPENSAQAAGGAVRLLKTDFSLPVYSPQSIPDAIVVVPDSAPALPSAPFAAAVIRRASLTEIQGGNAQKRTAAKREIEELIAQFHPEIAYSAELAANFFTLHKGGKTVFAVFDTDETISRRISRAAAAGAAAVFCDLWEK